MKKTVTTKDGIKLNVELTGDADKPKLILSISLGTTIQMWRPQIEALSDFFNIACYDTRGHGQSDAPDNEYSIDLLGQDVLAIADHLDWNTFNFAGVSMGAMTGFWLAINAPERVEKIIAANGGPMAGGPDVWNGRIEQVRKEGLGGLSNNVSKGWFTPDFLAAHPDIVNEVKTSFEKTSIAGYIGCCAALRDLDLRAGLASITVPMLIIGGEYDKTPAPDMLKMAADYVPGSQFRVLPAAHLSNIGASSEFNKALQTFLLD